VVVDRANAQAQGFAELFEPYLLLAAQNLDYLSACRVSEQCVVLRQVFHCRQSLGVWFSFENIIFAGILALSLEFLFSVGEGRAYQTLRPEDRLVYEVQSAQAF